MTNNKNISGLRVAILATNGVEQPELVEPRKALDEAGAKTTLIAPKPGKIKAMKHDQPGDEFEVDIPLSEADPNDFDAVLLPGGALNADQLRVENEAQEFVRFMDDSGKPIAVICHAPWLLISADLVDGRILTSYHTIQDDLENAGAQWLDKEAVRDQNWVSSRQPSDIPIFNHEMINLFAEYRAKRSEEPSGEAAQVEAVNPAGTTSEAA
jgi:protease I